MTVSEAVIALTIWALVLGLLIYLQLGGGGIP
jgi:hypothetical protein